MLGAYYKLTKPGIIYGNIMTTVAGFLLASKGDVDLGLLLAALTGTSLVIACGCVFNNYIDRDIDKRMARTKSRALVSGQIPVTNALVYGTILGLAGFTILILFTNLLTVLIGAIGLFFYLVMYSIWKRRSVYGTLVGSVSGATPIVAGYTAASNSFDAGAILLFIILALWQMPHFYAIAMFRFKDYRAAGLPVLPVKKGLLTAKKHIVGYICTFIIATALLTAFDYTGYIYLVVMAFFGFAWLRLGREGFRSQDETRWARKMFGFSLTVLLIFCLLISLDVVLP